MIRGSQLSDCAGTMLSVEGGVNVFVYNSDFISNGGPLHDGGAIHSSSPVSVCDSNFIENTGANNGGAILIATGRLIISGCNFTRNRVGSVGDSGAVFIRSQWHFNVTNTVFRNNNQHPMVVLFVCKNIFTSL